MNNPVHESWNALIQLRTADDCRFDIPQIHGVSKFIEILFEGNPAMEYYDNERKQMWEELKKGTGDPEIYNIKTPVEWTGPASFRNAEDVSVFTATTDGDVFPGEPASKSPELVAFRKRVTRGKVATIKSGGVMIFKFFAGSVAVILAPVGVAILVSKLLPFRTEDWVKALSVMSAFILTFVGSITVGVSGMKRMLARGGDDDGESLNCSFSGAEMGYIEVSINKYREDQLLACPSCGACGKISSHDRRSNRH